MTIHAIETAYKGYKFRSRTEARWAVAFDKLGLNWQYEAEGYDLGEIGRYLPDFWLPDQKTFVEIKPENKIKRTRKVYLAGKMGAGKDDWRHSMVYADFYPLSLDAYKKRMSEITPCLMLNGHSFYGPYRLDELSGHGSGHVSVCVEFDHGCPIDSDDEDEARSWVFSGCQALIRSADTFFAWIDTLNCYGTLAEIGYAFALDKEIWIGFDSDKLESSAELWFVGKMADKKVWAESPVDAFLQMDDKPQPYEQKCSALAQIADVILIEGLPDEDDRSYSADFYFKGQDRAYQLVRAGNLALQGNQLKVLHKGWCFPDTVEKVKSALRSAKQARFEYGARN